jgi:hypothetical protein
VELSAVTGLPTDFTGLLTKGLLRALLQRERAESAADRGGTPRPANEGTGTQRTSVIEAADCKLASQRQPLIEAGENLLRNSCSRTNSNKRRAAILVGHCIEHRYCSNRSSHQDVVAAAARGSLGPTGLELEFLSNRMVAFRGMMLMATAALVSYIISPAKSNGIVKRGPQTKPKHIGIANLARTDEFITRYYFGTRCHYHQKLRIGPFPAAPRLTNAHLDRPLTTARPIDMMFGTTSSMAVDRRHSAIGWTGHCGSHTLPPTRNDDDDDDLILDRFMSALAMGGLLFGWERLLHGRLCDNHTLPPTSNDDDDDDLILVRHDGSKVMMRSGRPRPTGGDTIAPAIKIGLHDGFSVGNDTRQCATTTQSP